MDCTDVIRGSECSFAGICECKPFYAEFNETSCVQGELFYNITTFRNGVEYEYDFARFGYERKTFLLILFVLYSSTTWQCLCIK